MAERATLNLITAPLKSDADGPAFARGFSVVGRLVTETAVRETCSERSCRLTYCPSILNA